MATYLVEVDGEGDIPDLAEWMLGALSDIGYSNVGITTGDEGWTP